MNSSDNALIVNPLPISENVPQDPADTQRFLSYYTRRVASTVNSKESALYSLQEIGTFKQIFTTGDPLKFRNIYRFCMDFVDQNGGNLTAVGSPYSFAHNITGIDTPTMLSGTGTTTEATPRFIPIPYVDASAIGDQIQLHVTSTDIVVTMGATAPTLSQCYVLFEYTKN